MKQMILSLMAMLLVVSAAAQPKRSKADVKKEKELVGTFVQIPENSFTMQEGMSRFSPIPPSKRFTTIPPGYPG